MALIVVIGKDGEEEAAAAAEDDPTTTPLAVVDDDDNILVVVVVVIEVMNDVFGNDFFLRRICLSAHLQYIPSPDTECRRQSFRHRANARCSDVKVLPKFLFRHWYLP